MIAITPGIDALLTELEASLDEQIELLEWRRRQLETLCTALRERDYDRVEALLEEIEQAQQAHRGADLRLRAARASLAKALGRSEEAFRLGWLVREIPQDRSARLDNRRERIRLLAGALRERNFEAAVILHESARINRMLLACLFPPQGVETYGAGGTVRPDRSGLVDAER